MFAEALKLFKDAVTGSVGAKTVQLMDLDCNQRLIVNGKGEYEYHQNPRSFHHHVPSSVAGLIAVVKTLPHDSIHISIQNDIVLVRADGVHDLDSTDGMEPVHLSLAIQRSPVLSMLSDFAEKTVMLSTSEVIRLIRASEMYQHIVHPEKLVFQIADLKWRVNASASSDSGMKASRASYGNDVVEEAVSEPDSALTDFTLRNVRAYSDHSMTGSADIQCFWEFDIQNQKLALSPYGGQLQKLQSDCLATLALDITESVDPNKVTVSPAP